MPQQVANSPTMNPAKLEMSGWRSVWSSYRLPIILSVAFLLLIGGAIYLQSTWVNGTELNAANWELRQFSFRRDPFTGKQLTGVQHRPTVSYGSWSVSNGTTVVDSSIASYLQPGLLKEERWDMVTIVQGSPGFGKANILVKLLQVADTSGPGTYHWVNWTSNHPAKAKVFWPAIQHLTTLNAYSLLPRAFQLPLDDVDDGEFVVQLNRFMRDSLDEYANMLRAAGDEEQAAEVVSVLQNYPANDELEPL